MTKFVVQNDEWFICRPEPFQFIHRKPDKQRKNLKCIFDNYREK
jgi:hypothetical protein